MRRARERGQAARKRRGPRHDGAHGHRETVGATKRGRARTRRCALHALGRNARRTGSIGVRRPRGRAAGCRPRRAAARACGRVVRALVVAIVSLAPARARQIGRRHEHAAHGRRERSRTGERGEEARAEPRRRVIRGDARRIVRVEGRAAPAFLDHRERRARAGRGRVDGGGTRPEAAAAAGWVLADGVARTAHGQAPAGGRHRASAIGPGAVRAYGTASGRHSWREGCGRGCVVLCKGGGVRTAPQPPPLERERERPGGVLPSRDAPGAAAPARLQPQPALFRICALSNASPTRKEVIVAVYMLRLACVDPGFTHATPPELLIVVLPGPIRVKCQKRRRRARRMRTRRGRGRLE
jgi:hypothetical protein